MSRCSDEICHLMRSVTRDFGVDVEVGPLAPDDFLNKLFLGRKDKNMKVLFSA